MLLKDFEQSKKISDTFKGLYEHVSVSLGPNGHTALIRQEGGNHIITKDGVTIVKHYKGEDDFSNTLIDIIKETSQRTDIAVGDGTTSTIVFAYHLYKELFNLINSGNSYVKLMRGVDDAITRAIISLSEFKEDVTTTDQVGNIAFVSSNNDKEVSGIIQKAFETVGNDGVIITSRNRRYSNTVLDLREGFAFDSGWISPKFVTNKESNVAEYYEPHILVTDYQIHTVKDIWPTLQLIAADKRPLLIVAESVDQEALASIITNVTQGTVAVCAVQAPYYQEERKAFYEDLCDITGATLISRYNGRTLSDVAIRDFGRCSKAHIGKKQTTIVNGSGDMEAVKKKVAMLRDEMAEMDDIEEVEEANARINRLASGVAEIFIGGFTEAEIKEKKYRYDDALNAVQAALKSGTVVGGGVTYINIAKALEGADLSDLEHEHRLGYMAVVKALHSPFRRLIESSGLTGKEEIILKEIFENQSQDRYGYNSGYNMLTQEHCDLREQGIIEPTLISKNVMRNSHSIVKLLLNSKAIIL